MTCLDDAALRAYLEGQLSPERTAEVEGHLAGCDACAARMSALPLDQPPDVTEASVPGATREEPAAPPLAPAAPSAPKVHVSPDALSEELSRGTVVGRYLILRKLGQGGMGTVYEAYDPELSRKVAVKLLRAAKTPGSKGTRSPAQARLLREAQAMARVSHPNVLAVHDVGTLDDRVFVAMELVDGGDLKAWLAERPRPWKELRDAFVAAGRGLAAAHAAGLVHRDFKPANVLVGRDGRIRVTDFGLARLADGQQVIEGPVDEADPSESTSSGVLAEPLTRAGTIMGTPQYMAPEQHLGQTADARSDQFSFCAALYYALYRQRPFEPQKLASEAARQLEADDPTRAEKLTERIRPVQVIRDPPRDVRVPAFLRKAVLRGLSLSPAARYPSMDALLLDLSKDPAARNLRAGAIAAAAVAVIASGVGYVRAQGDPAELCTGAEQQLAGVWDAATRAKVGDAFAATGHPLARPVFEEAASRLDAYAQRWTGSHLEACRATRVRGEQTEQVLSLRMICLERRRKELRAMGAVLASADRKTVERAMDAVIALPAVSACDDVEGLSQKVPLPDDPQLRARLEAAQTVLAEGKALQAAGRYPAALVLARQAVADAEAVAFRPALAEAHHLLGWLLDATGDWREGERYLMEAHWAADAVRDDKLRVDAAIRLVFAVGYHQSRYAEGIAWARTAEAGLARIGGDEPLAADLAQTVALIHLAQRRTGEARASLEKALELMRKLYGPAHPKVGYVLSNLGVLYLGTKDYPKAIEGLAASLDIIERTKGPEHISAGMARGNLATAYAGAGQHEQALQHAERALAIRRAAMGDDHPTVADALDILANVHVSAGRYEQGARTYQEALARKQKRVGKDDLILGYSLDGVGQAYLEAGRFQRAIPWYERALEVRKDDPAERAESRFGLARALWGAKKDPTALAKARQSVEDYESVGMTAEAAKVKDWIANVGR